MNDYDPMKCCTPHCGYEPTDVVTQWLGVEYDVCEAHRPDVEVRVARGDVADLIKRPAPVRR